MTPDRIELIGLRVVAPVGVCPEEHDRPQPIEIDLALETDISVAGRTDDLAGTVDYGAVIALAESVCRERHHELLEHLATIIAQRILEDPRVRAVEVCVKKLRPPVPQDIVHTAVRIRRENEPSPIITRAYLALGSNLGDRLGYLRLAVAELGSSVVARSRIYETDPVGGPDRQGPYLNMAVAIDTSLDPYALLRVCNQIEQRAGRVRSVRNGPRTLDIDILLFGDTRIDSEHLSVPHPRMAERRFVLQPLADIAPDLVPAGWDQTVEAGGVYPTSFSL